MKRILMLLIILLAVGGDAMAQARRITGRVLDETGQGLPGAGISVRGTTTGTLADAEGNFELDLPDGNNVIIVQFIGYGSQTVNVTGNSVTVTLSPATQELEGAVVTANAVRREKRSLGYSTTQVTGSELTAGGAINPLNALVGKTAGANITTTANAPGTSSRIVLRGGSSIGGNNQALIVVDGVPINNSNFQTNNNSNIGRLSNQVDYGNRGNDVNPEDIESISVLKGPAATALYGSLGANGAIMITTKRGKRRTGNTKTDIEVSSSYELSTVLKLPDFQNRYGQGDLNGIFDDRRENFSWGAEFDGNLRPWGQIIDGEQKVKPYSALPDNVKNFFNVGQTWNNNVALNGGNEQAAFRLSLGSVNSKSVFPGKKYDRYTVGFNGNANLTNKFYANTALTYVNVNSDLTGFGQDASPFDAVLQTPRDIPITELQNIDDKFNSMDYLDENGVHRYGYYGAYTENPYYTLKNYKNLNRVDRVFGNFTIGYNINDWLRLENRAAGDLFSDRRFQEVPKYTSEAADLTPGLYVNNEPHTSLGRYSEDIYNVNNLYNDLMLMGNKDLNADLNLNFILGWNVSQYRSQNTFASTNEEGGLSIPGYYNLTNSNGPILGVSELNRRRKASYYADVNFGFRNMLFFGASGRTDWSSTIDGSYFYPGVNAAFVFSELFPTSLRNNTWNYGKLRVAYAAVANDALAYSDRTYYEKANPQGNFGNTQFPFNSNIPGFTYDNTLGNPGLTPEFVKEFEIGAENAFFNNRLTVDISVYNKWSTNQIVAITLPSSSGFTFQYVNTGKMTNKGVELSLRGTPVQTATGFKWDLFATYTNNTNKVVEIFPGTDQVNLGGYVGMNIVSAVGKPFGTFYSVGHVYTPDGKIVVDSSNGIPIISDTAMYFGTYLPDFQASWGTTLSYKGLSLNLLFDMKKGGVFYSRTRDIMGFVGTSEETGDRVDKVWENSVIQTGENTYVENTVPYSTYEYFTTAGLRPSSANLVDASYVKLREARLTYVLPKSLFSKTFIGGASISLYGNNLFIWTPDENKYVDPEINSAGSSNAQGFDFTAHPSLRNYGINVRLTF